MCVSPTITILLDGEKTHRANVDKAPMDFVRRDISRLPLKIYTTPLKDIAQ